MKKNILVIDDDTLLTKMISRCLTTNGYAVTTTASGDEAISLLEVHGFDLVLCDIHMDGKDGFAVLATCKTRHPKTKVILCSGDVAYETISMAFKCGADSFLAKPFLSSELQYQVGRFLDQAQKKLPLKIELQSHTASVVGQAGCFG